MIHSVVTGRIRKCGIWRQRHKVHAMVGNFHIQQAWIWNKLGRKVEFLASKGLTFSVCLSYTVNLEVLELLKVKAYLGVHDVSSRSKLLECLLDACGGSRVARSKARDLALSFSISAEI